MKIPTLLLFNEKTKITKNINNKATTNKPNYTNSLKHDCFVSFGNTKQSKPITITMGKDTSKLYNQMMQKYDSIYEETQQSIIKNLTKDIGFANLISLKINKLFCVSIKAGTPENPVELTKSPDNANNYLLTYKDDKNDTQKIILSKNKIQIEPESTLSPENSDKIVFNNLNKLKIECFDHEMREKTADIVKSKLELMNRLQNIRKNFIESTKNEPWNFHLKLDNPSKPEWSTQGHGTSDLLSKLETEKHPNSRINMHQVHYGRYGWVYRIDNFDKYGNLVSFYNLDQDGTDIRITELTSNKYHTIYNHPDPITTFKQDGIDYTLYDTYRLSANIENVGEVTTGSRWIKIKKDNKTEYFKFSDTTPQKLVEYSITDDKGVIKKYNPQNFEILESIKKGNIEKILRRDGSLEKEINSNPEDLTDSKTISEYRTDGSLEKESFYMHSYSEKPQKIRTYRPDGTIEKEIVWPDNPSKILEFRTDGTLKTKLNTRSRAPEIFRYSENKAFKEAGEQTDLPYWQQKEYNYTENYAEDGKTIVSYTFNDITETLEQLTKNKKEYIKQKELLAEERKAEERKAKKIASKKKGATTQKAKTKKNLKSVE